MINLSALKENIDLEIEASKKESPDIFRCGMLLAEIVSEALEQQIAADVVEVVRCKNCKYREDRLYCRLHEHPIIVTNTDYCSYGKRREE